MRKKLMIIVLVLSIILQLSVPVAMIIYSQNTEDALSEYGKEFRIKVYVQNIVDGSVDYRFYEYNMFRLGYYAVLEEDADGYVNLSTIQKSKPDHDNYIRITMDNKAKFADFKIDSDMTAWTIKEESAYLVIKAYKGEVEVVNLYMDDIPAEEWFNTAIAEKDEDYDIVLFPEK